MLVAIISFLGVGGEELVVGDNIGSLDDAGGAVSLLFKVLRVEVEDLTKKYGF